MHLYVSLIAVVLAFMQLVLGLLISLRRMRGEQAEDSFIRLTRIFGNCAEHVPLALLMLLMFEISGGPGSWVLAIGAAFVVARLMHAVGMAIRMGHPLHTVGASLTYTVEAVLVVILGLRYIST